MYYTPHQASQMLGISKITLIRWENEKKIPPAKRNYLNHRVYTEEEIKNINKIMGLDVIKDPLKEVVQK